jgi:osmotically-inducible protein OsmY
MSGLIRRNHLDVEKIDIGARVAAAILSDSGIGKAVIEIDEQDGSVTLRGKTSTEHDIQAMEKIATRQDGVVKVINELTSK